MNEHSVDVSQEGIAEECVTRSLDDGSDIRERTDASGVVAGPVRGCDDFHVCYIQRVNGEVLATENNDNEDHIR